MKKIIRQNKKILLLTSLLIFLPVIAGLILWGQLPDQIATHWGADGQPDGWSSRAFAVFLFPLILLAFHWICIAATAFDPRNQNQSEKVLHLVLWICPILSIFSGILIYGTALGVLFHAKTIPMLLIGLLFLLIGNYLPKCKQNHTIGIRIRWTLADEENWHRTHHLTGKIWAAGGVLLMILAFLPDFLFPWALLAVLSVITIFPILYSWQLNRKHKG